MSFTTITDSELVGLGVTGLDDTPELSTEDMQAQFDEYPQFLKDKYKVHIQEEEANTAASNIGALIPTELDNVEEEKVQPILDELAKRVKDQKDWQDAADENFHPAELNTDAFHADNETVTAPTPNTDDVSEKVATTEFVDNKMQAIGEGDMAKSVYDPNDRGVVESAYKVGESYVESITESQADYPVPAQNDKIKVVIGKIIKNLNDIRTKVATHLTNGVMSKEDKIKLDDITEDAQAPDYGSCTTAGSTAAKVITVSNTDFKLKTGVVIGVDFSNVNTAQNPTFNVNNTGAKGVMFKKNVITDSNISYAGNTANTMLYMYNGTYWVYVGDVDPVYDTALSNTSTNAVQNKKVNSAVSHALAKLAETDISNATKASRPHTAGNYLIYGSVSDPKFGQVLTDIAVNEAWNSQAGGNITDVSVADEISTLKDALNEATNDSGWQFLFSESSGFCKYRKIGKLVEIKIAYNDSFVSKNFGTLPQGFRPSNERVVAPVNGGGAGNQLAYVEIRTDGNVIMAASSSITGATANVMYFIG